MADGDVREVGNLLLRDDRGEDIYLQRRLLPLFHKVVREQIERKGKSKS